MDNLAYRYLPNSNKLDHVDDPVTTSNYSVDIDDQDTLNYKYDNIGNLISDATAKLTKIDWTVYGKIKSINKPSVYSIITYYYDASGNRLVKDVTGSSGLVRTFYVRELPRAIQRECIALKVIIIIGMSSNYTAAAEQVPGTGIMFYL